MMFILRIIFVSYFSLLDGFFHGMAVQPGCFVQKAWGDGLAHSNFSVDVEQHKACLIIFSDGWKGGEVRNNQILQSQKVSLAFSSDRYLLSCLIQEHLGQYGQFGNVRHSGTRKFQNHEFG